MPTVTNLAALIEARRVRPLCHNQRRPHIFLFEGWWCMSIQDERQRPMASCLGFEERKARDARKELWRRARLWVNEENRKLARGKA